MVRSEQEPSTSSSQIAPSAHQGVPIPPSSAVHQGTKKSTHHELQPPYHFHRLHYR